MMNFFGLVVTVLFYKLAEVLKRFPVLSKLPPIIIAGAAIIVMLECFHINFETYNKSASYLTFMLMPATIALGYPIYKNIELLKQNKRVIYTAFFAATVFAIVTTYLTAKFCHADLCVIESMLPKSVTAPIAVEISKNIGGIPELTACVVVLTGVFGGMFGHKILELVRIKNDIAIGLSIGAASHVVGTARCVEKGNEKQIVMASLALVIVGVLTAIAAPVFLHLIK